jgi:preprotein translocase subunit YajC
MNTLLLQAAGNSGLINLVFIGLMIIVFYFFMILPQKRKAKEQRTFMEDLQKGDEIVTASGILGRINKIEGNIVTVDIGNKTFMRVTRNAISQELTTEVFSAAKEEA